MLITILFLLLVLDILVGWACTQWYYQRTYHDQLDAVIKELQRHSVFTAPHGPHGPVK